ncbi:MAG: glutaminase [Rhodospirillaceae bacterium]|jgi:glutaminase|nr:glutaminase [Rhodospirillaceae bacterium]MBT5458482.1 glutaminase [Rhodospirillaceae bacterium]
MASQYQIFLDEIAREIRPHLTEGKVADYIPALAAVPADRFAMAVSTVDGDDCGVGDADVRFSVQSISKVFTLTLALQAMGRKLWDRLGREPSGDPFNSLVQLEHEHGIPRNPYINAGALVVVDCLLDHYADPKSAILDFVREITGANDIVFDAEVAKSEADWGYRNRALANFVKSFGNLHHDVDTVLDTYFHHCALAMSCRELAFAFEHLADGGVSRRVGREVTTAQHTKRVNSLMLTCGLYDSVGDFAYRVGIPAKSGVGGGIAAVIPGKLAVCVYSPGLDEGGNSYAGTRALELFTQKTAISIF